MTDEVHGIEIDGDKNEVPPVLEDNELCNILTAPSRNPDNSIAKKVDLNKVSNEKIGVEPHINKLPVGQVCEELAVVQKSQENCPKPGDPPPPSRKCVEI